MRPPVGVYPHVEREPECWQRDFQTPISVVTKLMHACNEQFVACMSVRLVETYDFGGNANVIDYHKV